ncbi:MAG: acetylglutamate kinase [Chloroflexota bacterium]
MAGKLEKATVVKIGGSTLGSEDTTLEDVVSLQKQNKPVVIVHGGGAIITSWLKKMNIPTSFVRGERITDSASLEVVTAVLAGLVNKDIVASINNRGGRAIGISGVDGGLVQNGVANMEKGYVGGKATIDITPLKVLLEGGYIPVVAPVSLYAQGRAEEAPGVLNNNADIIAGEIAAAISAERLIFLTDVTGIYDKQGKLLPLLSSAEAESLIASGVASGGMIPKIRACLQALSVTGSAGIIDGRKPHALIREIEGANSGTVIKAV